MSCCGQPSSPKTLCLLPFLPVPITAASGTLQPSLHHRALLHPQPAGKSPAVGWPLSTGFVLLHKMNCCGVGVGEAGHREQSRGSGWLGVPSFAWGQGGAAGSEAPPHQPRSPSPSHQPPQGRIWLFLLTKPRQRWRCHKPRQHRALALSLCLTRWDLSRCLCSARMSPGSLVGMWVHGWGGFALGEEDVSLLKSHWYLPPNLYDAIHSAGRHIAPWDPAKPK